MIRARQISLADLLALMFIVAMIFVIAGEALHRQQRMLQQTAHENALPR